MAQHWDVYRVGAKLGAVRDLVRMGNSDYRREFQRHEQLLSSVAVCRVGSPRSGDGAPSLNSDQYLLARILLGMLQRGHAPLVSPLVEASLLSRTRLPVHMDRSEVPEIQYHLDVEGSDAEVLRGRFRDVQFATDDRVVPFWGDRYGSFAEQRFVDEQLRPILGQALPLLEPQRPLTSMLDPDRVDLQQFRDQRVDFALETTSIKVAFEIDGPQHRQQSQNLQDQDRDSALLESGWVVERIRLEGSSSGISSEVREKLLADRWLATLRSRPESKGANHVGDAWTLILGSHAVARVQLAVLVAILEGVLTWGAKTPWRIAVVERDTALVRLALVDLLRQLHALADIYGVEVPDSINVFVVGPGDEADMEEDEIPTHDCLHVTSCSLDEIAADGSLDLVIDVSVLARPADRFTDWAVTQRMALLGVPIMYLRTANYRQGERQWSWCPARAVMPSLDANEAYQFFLQVVFRKRAFRPQQLDVIRRAMERKNLVGLLPTGSGKSVTFQLPTLLSPGAAIVIAPLRALIDDQADNLHRTGISRFAPIHGGMDDAEKQKNLRAISRDAPRFIYVAPERLQVKKFREELRSSPLAQAVTFVVIDEAHCVSEWGHDFRPSYLNVGRVARDLCSGVSGTPPILALTGTASDTVLIDIVRELDMDRNDESLVISASSFERPELNFLPIRASNGEKINGLMLALDQTAELLDVPTTSLVGDASNGGLVFCRYVNGSFGVDGVSQSMRRRLDLDDEQLRIFAGQKPKKLPITDDEWNTYKKKTQQAFKDDAFSLLVSTSSFGMGVDKSNIRYTVHYGIPGSLEALAQEAGRAGRNRLPAGCAVVFSGNDTYDFLSPDMDTESARRAVDAISYKDQDDVSRVMFLHFQSYPGVDVDIVSTRQIMTQILRIWSEMELDGGATANLVLRRRGMNDKSGEHALYRLSVLGIVRDYTIDYGRNQYEVETIRIDPDLAMAHLAQFVRRYDIEGRAELVAESARMYQSETMPSQYDHVIQALCTFVYDVIERSRRRSLENLVQGLKDADGDGDALGRYLANFLSQNVFTSAVAAVAQGAHLQPDSWWEIVDRANTVELVSKLLAVTRRQLESSPTHPGLLLMEAVAAAMGSATDAATIAGSLLAGLSSYESIREADDPPVEVLVRKTVSRLARSSDERFDQVIEATLSRTYRDDLARAAYSHVSSPRLKRVCAASWLASMTGIARGLRETTMGVKG